MRKALEKHICTQVEIRGSKVKIRPWQGLLFLELIEGKESDVEDALRHTFGLTSADPFFPIEVDPVKVAEAVISNAPNKEGATFAVQCKRHGEKNSDWNSQTFAGAVGAEILALAPHLKVNLGEPEWAVRIALMNDKVAILGDRILCQGGLPTGVQGTVLVDLQTERDYLASWLVMRRGCRLSFTPESKSDLMELVSIWDPYYKSEKIRKILATAPGPGHVGEIWAIVGDKLSGRLETEGKIPIATLEPLEGWLEESLEELRHRAESTQAIA